MKLLISIILLLSVTIFPSKGYADATPSIVEQQDKKNSKQIETKKPSEGTVENRPPAKPSELKTFIPTEKITADSIITFPTDI